MSPRYAVTRPDASASGEPEQSRLERSDRTAPDNLEVKITYKLPGPLLDASGWAVNAKAKLNMAFGTSLTGVARLPDGSTRVSKDRFSDKRSPWPKVALFVVIVCFFFSLLNHVYVLDAIYFRATGKHNPAWFKPAPSADTNGPTR